MARFQTNTRTIAHSSQSTERSIEVWADWESLAEPVRVGRLEARYVRTEEIFSFTYDDAWVHSPSAIPLDPELRLVAGPQYGGGSHRNFGVFLDSAPDRWGRVLMDRREALEASDESRQRRVLYEADYLLGVHDPQRLGGLRFRTQPLGPFVDNREHLAAPPLAQLRDLEYASRRIEETDAEDQPSYRDWLNLLLAPGSSLGGARPKANVTDDHGQLWIAKFPSKNDGFDRGAWEFVAHQLATAAGIDVSEANCARYSPLGSTFLTRRFDRTATGGRVHFISAMSALQHADYEEASYIEIAEYLQANGSHTAVDLEQLWRRVVYFVLMSNNDDHLRNHGFILDGAGWRLAPAYDVNPVERPRGQSLMITDSDNRQDLDLVRELAPLCRVSTKRAGEIINEVRDVARTWRSVAKDVGIAGGEIEQMSMAFELTERS